MANKAISLEQMSRIWGKVKNYVAASISGLYTKPSGGIPKSDLSSEVQTSLGKADTALQSFTESDPTVPAWAKQPSKPTYTASEVGALPDSTTIPTKTSDLTNDSGFLSQHQSLKTIGGNEITGSGNIPWPTYTANDTGALPNTTTLADLEDSTHKTVTPTEKATWIGKQDAINDLADIRSGAALGATALQEHQDISGKADKVQNATANNVALLDANGNCIDSGKAFTPQGIGALPSSTDVLYANRVWNSSSPKMITRCPRNVLCLTYDETYMLPINTDGSTVTTKILTDLDFDPFGQILIPPNSFINAESSSIYMLAYHTLGFDLRISFNITSALTVNRSVYLVMVPQSNGRCKLHSNPISQNLPTTEDGLVYKFLGRAVSANNGCLEFSNPCYYFKDGKLRLWTGG